MFWLYLGTIARFNTFLALVWKLINVFVLRLSFIFCLSYLQRTLTMYAFSCQMNHHQLQLTHENVDAYTRLKRITRNELYKRFSFEIL